jgi:hypothetical protein
MPMSLLIGCVLAVLIILLVVRFVFGRAPVRPWMEHLGDAQTIITIVAAIVAASWYFVERPRSARLKFDQSVVGAPGPSGRALILAEVSFTNLGASALAFGGSPYTVRVERVTPMPPDPLAEVGTRDKSGVFLIHEGDLWSNLAALSSTSNSFLEAGETENLYFRVVIPCLPGMRVYFSSWFTKPKSPSDFLFGPKDVAWTKQTLVDLSNVCPTAVAGRSPAGSRARSAPAARPRHSSPKSPTTKG